MSTAAMSTELAHGPAFGIVLTLSAWLLAKRVWVLTGRHPLTTPPLLAIVLVVAALWLLDVPYADYLRGAEVFTWLLAPSVIALAVPFRRQQAAILAAWPAIAAALLVSAVTGVGLAVGLARLAGLPNEAVASVAPHSATAGLSMGVAARSGGDAGLAVCLTIATGCLTAAFALPLARLFGMRDAALIGFAAGAQGHGIATARMLQWQPTAGAFAGIAMLLNGVVTALLVPLVLRVW